MKKYKKTYTLLTLLIAIALPAILSGCGKGTFAGYSNQWLYPQDVSTVYVEMFDSKSYRRDHEYDLTDAICKRIEAHTPYKIVTDRDLADTVISGQITSIGARTLSIERNVGRPLEREAIVNVQLTWKNLKTGEILINNQSLSAAGAYSTFMGQTFDYAADLAVNEAAKKVVELMEDKW
jgi:hypothetical protein